MLYTHNAEQKREPQQMQHECHDRILRKERREGGGDEGDRNLKKQHGEGENRKLRRQFRGMK